MRTQDIRPLAEIIAAREREYIIDVLTCTNGRKTRAAKLLGISRKNLWEKLTTYKIVVEKVYIEIGDEEIDDGSEMLIVEQDRAA